MKNFIFLFFLNIITYKITIKVMENILQMSLYHLFMQLVGYANEYKYYQIEKNLI